MKHNRLQVAPNFYLDEFEADNQCVRLHPLLPARCQDVRDDVNYELIGSGVLKISRDAYRSKGSEPLIINSACRTWEQHLNLYLDLYPALPLAQVVVEKVPLRSHHLIEVPDVDDLLSAFAHSKSVMPASQTRVPGCCAVDLQLPFGMEIATFRKICDRHFTFVYQMSDTALHCDLRGVSW